MCPHGVFPVAGDDKWIAIACATDQQWQSLSALLDEIQLNDALDTLEARKAHEDELEAIISNWTTTQDGNALQDKLIACGIPAHVLHNSETAWSDTQFAHRQHFITVPQSAVGEVVVESTRFHLQGTPAVIETGPPTTGEHNIELLTNVLGYDDDKVADVLASLCME